MRMRLRVLARVFRDRYFPAGSFHFFQSCLEDVWTNFSLASVLLSDSRTFTTAITLPE